MTNVAICTPTIQIKLYNVMIACCYVNFHFSLSYIVIIKESNFFLPSYKLPSTKNLVGHKKSQNVQLLGNMKTLREHVVNNEYCLVCFHEVYKGI